MIVCVYALALEHCSFIEMHNFYILLKIRSIVCGILNLSEENGM